jgi:dTDP-glucose 4,6-dehydratase
MNLLNAAKIWKKHGGKRFLSYQYRWGLWGLGAEGLFTESTAYDPNSYSASKASSDHFVRAYGENVWFALCY